jgi:hypothetical protein
MNADIKSRTSQKTQLDFQILGRMSALHALDKVSADIRKNPLGQDILDLYMAVGEVLTNQSKADNFLSW